VRLRDSASGLIGACSVATAVFAVGGAFRWIAGIVALLVACSVTLVVTSRRGFAQRSPLVALLATAFGLTALQLVPLPAAWLEHLQPVGHALRADGSIVADVHPWQALTLDAPGTLRAATFLLTLLGASIVALRFASAERGRLVCLGLVAATCGVVALVVGIHTIFGATALYGVYDPIHATPPVLGPLLNANHLGALTALGAVLSAGLIFYTKQSNAARATWAVTLVICIAVVFATLSRGALLALLVGLGVTLSTLLAQRIAPATQPLSSKSRRAKLLANTVPLVIVAVCALVIVIYTSAGTAAEQLRSTSLDELQEPTSKFAAWRASLQLVEESPWLGIGRGALEPVFTRVHPASGFVTFSHLENEYLQALVEWGIPGAIALGACLMWLAVRAVRRWRDGALIAASFGGLAAVAVESCVDFGIELLGFALPATIVAATVAYVPLQRVSNAVLTRTRVLRGLLVTALLASAILLYLPVTRTVDEAHRAAEQVTSMSGVRAMIEDHPLDYYNYAIGAELLLRARDPQAIALLNHALRLHPTHAGLHRLAGRILLATNHMQQAAIEYATALRYSSDPRELLLEIPRRFSPEVVPAAIPTDYPNVDLVTRTLVDSGNARVAIAWMSRLVDADPTALANAERLYALAVAQHAWPEAEHAAHLRVERNPTPRNRLMLAELLARRGAHADVVDQLADVGTWHGRVKDQVTAWFLLCDSYLALRRFDDATRCLRRLDGSGLLRPADRSQIARRLEEIAQARETAAP
jgi:O-antigen ligase